MQILEKRKKKDPPMKLTNQSSNKQPGEVDFPGEISEGSWFKAERMEGNTPFDI